MNNNEGLDKLRQLFVEQGCKSIDVYDKCGKDFDWVGFIKSESVPIEYKHMLHCKMELIVSPKFIEDEEV